MRRSEVWWAALPKPAGPRPVVLVSRDDAYAVRDFVMVAPVTSRIRRIFSEVPLGTQEGLRKDCVVNLDSLETIPKGWLQQRISSLPATKMLEIDEALRYALGLRD